MADSKGYPGIFADRFGGMTDTGKIIRDAWVFGLIPESETCAGWSPSRIEKLWEQVDAEWARYGFRVANLPPALRERFDRIQADALARAREQGWDPDSVFAEDE